MRRNQQVTVSDDELRTRLGASWPEAKEFYMEAVRLGWNVMVDDSELGLLSFWLGRYPEWMGVDWRHTQEGRREVVKVADKHGPLSGLDEARHKLQLPYRESWATKQRRRFRRGRKPNHPVGRRSALYENGDPRP